MYKKHADVAVSATFVAVDDNRLAMILTIGPPLYKFCLNILNLI